MSVSSGSDSLPTAFLRGDALSGTTLPRGRAIVFRVPVSIRIPVKAVAPRVGPEARLSTTLKNQERLVYCTHMSGFVDMR